MKTTYSPKPLIVLVLCLYVSMACRDTGKPDTSDTAGSLSEKAREEQEKRKSIEEEAKRQEVEKERKIKELEEELPKPITDLFLLYNNKQVPRGYSAIWKDLNKGAGGDDIFLCYTKDPSKGKPITSIKVRFDRNVPRSHEHINCNSGKPCDVNRDAGGEDIFIYTGRNPSEGKPITDVDVLFGDPVAKSDWELI